MATKKTKKNEKKYCCNLCDFNTSKLIDYNRHILTQKHIRNKTATDGNENLEKQHTYSCEKCGKEYNDRTGLWRHNKKCILDGEKKLTELDKDNLIITLLKQNADLIKGQQDILKEQQDIIIKLTENGINNTNYSNNTTNSHNKAFNLNFFLNETCKNAMNITDFVDSIKLQMNDLIEVGELGYVEGISKIIVKNLNNLDETERPIHCTDKKRETMYIKDEGEWNKEDEKKSMLKKAINKVVDKNIRLLPAFRENFPDYKNSSSKTSDKYDKMVIEVMTCDDDKKEKIIKNISKAITIDAIKNKNV